MARLATVIAAASVAVGLGACGGDEPGAAPTAAPARTAPAKPTATPTPESSATAEARRTATRPRITLVDASGDAALADRVRTELRSDFAVRTARVAALRSDTTTVLFARGAQRLAQRVARALQERRASNEPVPTAPLLDEPLLAQIGARVVVVLGG